MFFVWCTFRCMYDDDDDDKHGSIYNGMALNLISLLLFCYARHRGHFHTTNSLTSVNVAGTSVQLVKNIKFLALLLILILLYGSIPSVSPVMFYHIRAFRHMHAVLDKSTAADIAAALVSSRLDYAKSVLCGSPSMCLTRLQRIQNSVARIVLQQPSLSSRDTLQLLHWLPVKWRIQFKLASLTYTVLHTGTPSYLSERLHPYVLSRTTHLAIILLR